MTARVVGLGGRLRAGKDAVADHLVAEHGFKKIGMSDALHEAMLALDPIIYGGPGGEEFRYSWIIERRGYVEAKKETEVRRLLQKLGSEVGRDMIGQNTWVNITARKIDDHLYADQPVVVTGIRFPNELQMLRQFAGRSVWVERPSLTAGAASTHQSENGLGSADFDEVIVNDGTLSDLAAKAARLAL